MTAVEWLVKQIKKDLNLRLRGFDIDEIGKKAKEMEKQQQGYSEEEVIKFVQYLNKFDNLDNESEYVIKELLKLFKNK